MPRSLPRVGLLVIVAAVFGTFSSIRAQCSENILINPDFETVDPPCGPTSTLINGAFNMGCMTGWAAAWGTPSVCAVNPHAGNYFACFGANNEGMFQNIFPCPNAMYLLSFWYRNINGNIGNLDVYLANGLVNQPMSNSGNPPLPPQPSWQLIASIPALTGGWHFVNLPPFSILDPVNTQLLFLDVPTTNIDIGVDDVLMVPIGVLDTLDVLLDILCTDQEGPTYTFTGMVDNLPPDYTIVSMNWTFGDGGIGSGSPVMHTFDTYGEYQICLDVLDNCGCTASYCTMISYTPCSCACGLDEDPPFVINPPAAIVTVSCPQDIPPADLSGVVDLCDSMPDIQFFEETMGPVCQQVIQRMWILQDHCGHTTSLDQTIIVNVDPAPPIIYNTPAPMVDVSCIDDIPDITILDIEDDCENIPVVEFEEEFFGPPCDLTIQRTWSILDYCGETTMLHQTISFVDDIAPHFTQLPADTLVYCMSDMSIFTNWLNTHSGGIAIDECSPVLWSYTYDHPPVAACDTVSVLFTVTDNCANSTSAMAAFVVQDTVTPAIFGLPANLFLPCGPPDTALIQAWLDNHGGYQAADDCGEVFWSDDFIGDFSADSLRVVFTVRDACHNQLDLVGWIIQATTVDTLSLVVNTCDPFQVHQDTSFELNGLCQLMIISNWILLPSDTVVFNEYTCDSALVGLDTSFFQNQAGCDSLVIQQILLANVVVTQWVQSTCDPKAVGVDTMIYAGQYCDSLVVIETVLNISDTLNLHLFTCDQADAGVDTFRYVNQYGCDSIVIAMLEWVDADTTYLFSATCELTEAGITEDTFLNLLGCDSLVIINTLYQPSDTTVLEMTSCDPMDTVTAIFLLQNQFGCDSLVLLHVGLVSVDTQFIIRMTCDSSLAGTEAIWLPGVICDTLQITQTIYAPPQITIDTVYTCDDEGEMSDTVFLQNVFGCDSLLVHRIEQVSLKPFVHSIDETCSGWANGFISIDSVQGGQPPYQFRLNQAAWLPFGAWDNLLPGAYGLEVMDVNGCVDSVGSIVIGPGQSLVVDAGPDWMAELGELISLQLESNAPLAEVHWTALDELSCQNCLMMQVGPITVEQEVLVQAISEAGCQATDQLQISILSETPVYIPNSFSPNQDGMNDFFYAFSAVEDLDFYGMTIYDRWGNMIFDRDGISFNVPAEGWDGMCRDMPLAPGVYVFVIEVFFTNGDARSFAGDVTLIR